MHLKFSFIASLQTLVLSHAIVATMVSERVAESIKMAASIPRSDKEQELSHIMMVELLA